jgi:fucose permease
MRRCWASPRALLLGFWPTGFRQRTIILGLSLYGLSSLLVALGGRFPALVAMLALSGLGISVFKTAALALIGDITSSPQAHTRFMNHVEGWFAVGAIVGPAIVAASLTAGVSWKWLYVVAAAICFALVVMTSRVPSPAPRVSVERASLAQMLAIMRDPLALGFSLLVALYVGVEVAIYTWMPTYLKDFTPDPHTWWPWALTAFVCCRAAGRFLGAWMLDCVRWTTVRGLGLAIFICFSGALLGGLSLGAWLLPLTGLFMSIIYPTLNSKAISCFPRHQHGAAAGVILFFTALAAALGPLAMGALSDAWRSPRAGFVLASAFRARCFAGLALNWLRDPSRGRLGVKNRYS